MKAIVITGSTRGIGLAMAEAFLKAGCCVSLSGRGKELPSEAVRVLAPYGDLYLYRPCDVQSENDLMELWAQSNQKWGRVDIWINNAGQSAPYAKIWDTKDDFVDSVLDTNLKGAIRGSCVAARNMLRQGGGQIFNMEGLGSDGGIVDKNILYGTSKNALTYFTRGLAKELAGTPVCAGRLSPGLVLTDFITKAPDGGPSPALENPSFRNVVNALGQKPTTIAAFFVPRILSNKKNGAHIKWLTRVRALAGFMLAPIKKRKLV